MRVSETLDKINHALRCILMCIRINEQPGDFQRLYFLITRKQ